MHSDHAIYHYGAFNLGLYIQMVGALELDIYEPNKKKAHPLSEYAFQLSLAPITEFEIDAEFFDVFG